MCLICLLFSFSWGKQLGALFEKSNLELPDESNAEHYLKKAIKESLMKAIKEKERNEDELPGVINLNKGESN